jgi:hypothetical protein
MRLRRQFQSKVLEAKGLTLDEVSSFQSEMKRLGLKPGNS